MIRLAAIFEHVPALNKKEIISCIVVGALFVIATIVTVVSKNETILTKGNNFAYVTVVVIASFIFYLYIKEKN